MSMNLPHWRGWTPMFGPRAKKPRRPLPSLRAVCGGKMSFRRAAGKPEGWARRTPVSQRSLCRSFSFAPPGLAHLPLCTHGLRRGLHSFAASAARIVFLRSTFSWSAKLGYSDLRRANFLVTVRPSWLAWTMTEESGNADSSTWIEISAAPTESVTA